MIDRNYIDRIIAKLDKCSRNRKSNRVYCPFGRITMYKSDEHGRHYAIAGSLILQNCGSCKLSTIRRLLLQFV